MRHRLLGEDADVHRVAIALDAGHAGALRAALADALAAIGLRDEAVERRWLAGVALRPIDFQVTTSLVQFVLHRIGGRDLDEGLHHSGRIAGIDAVPRMRLEHRLQQLVEIVAHAKLRTSARSASAAAFKTGAPSPTSTVSGSRSASRRSDCCSAGRSSITFGGSTRRCASARFT